MHEGEDGAASLGDAALVARPLHGLADRGSRQLRNHARCLGGGKRCAMSQDPGIHHQQLFARARLSPQHDQTEANLSIDGQNEFRKLRFAQAPIERCAKLRHLRILGHRFQRCQMQLLIYPQNTFCHGLGYGQDAGLGALDQRLEEGGGILRHAQSAVVGATGGINSVSRLRNEKL